MFRIAATDQQAAQALGRYLDREQRGKKLTVVYNEIFYLRAIADRSAQSSLTSPILYGRAAAASKFFGGLNITETSRHPQLGRRLSDPCEGKSRPRVADAKS